MNKKELINAVANHLNTSEGLLYAKKDIKAILDATTTVIEQAVSHGDKVSLINFGTFKTTPRKGYVINDPRGELVAVPPTWVVRFSVGKRFKKTVTTATR